MKTKLALIIIFVLILAAVLGELFYFRFHTYFLRTEVNEALPGASLDNKNTVPAVGAVSQTVAQGSFVEIDAFHKGSGTARIIMQEEKRYLRLENFEVTNGPDLYVYLSESKNPSNDIKSLDKYIILGPLKGSVGDQNYEIPEPFRGYDTAVIWCQKFGVLFSYALMK